MWLWQRISQCEEQGLFFLLFSLHSLGFQNVSQGWPPADPSLNFLQMSVVSPSLAGLCQSLEKIFRYFPYKTDFPDTPPPHTLSHTHTPYFVIPKDFPEPNSWFPTLAKSTLHLQGMGKMGMAPLSGSSWESSDKVKYGVISKYPENIVLYLPSNVREGWL